MEYVNESKDNTNPVLPNPILIMCNDHDDKEIAPIYLILVRHKSPLP